ncbi:Cyclin-dependent kinase 2-interacting protein, partial [Stegodyphus mimosarum]
MSSSRLTGNARIVQDCCIDLYNNVQKWRRNSSEASFIFCQLCELKHKELERRAVETEEEASDSMVIDAIMCEIQILIPKLNTELRKMMIVYEKMLKIENKLKAIHELSEMQHSGGTHVDLNPFKNWTVSGFFEATEEIIAMHAQELKTKLSISEELPISSDRSHVLFLESSWKYETEIDRHRVDFLLFNMRCQLDLQLEL